MSNFGNGGYKPIPNNDIYSPLTPNGTYGVITPPFGSFGNSNTTPQLSGTTIVKGNGYVRYEYPTGQFTVVNTENGMMDTGWK